MRYFGGYFLDYDIISKLTIIQMHNQCCHEKYTIPLVKYEDLQNDPLYITRKQGWQSYNFDKPVEQWGIPEIKRLFCVVEASTVMNNIIMVNPNRKNIADKAAYLNVSSQLSTLKAQITQNNTYISQIFCWVRCAPFFNGCSNYLSLFTAPIPWLAILKYEDTKVEGVLHIQNVNNGLVSAYAVLKTIYSNALIVDQTPTNDPLFSKKVLEFLRLKIFVDDFDQNYQTCRLSFSGITVGPGDNAAGVDIGCGFGFVIPFNYMTNYIVAHELAHMTCDYFSNEQLAGKWTPDNYAKPDDVIGSFSTTVYGSLRFDGFNTYKRLTGHGINWFYIYAYLDALYYYGYKQNNPAYTGLSPLPTGLVQGPLEISYEMYFFDTTKPLLVQRQNITLPFCTGSPGWISVTKDPF